MIRNKIVLTLAVLAMGGSAFAVTFTGDVAADFNGLNYVEVQDTANDVGLPNNAPANTVTGWDIDRALFDLDLTTGELNVGIDFFSYAGDADDDGGEGTSSPWLLGNGGIDLPNLEQTESICIAFDFDQNGSYDVVAGVSSWGSAYQVAAYSQSFMGLSFNFGSDLAGHANGHFYGMDYELSISNIAQLVTPVNNTICFDFAIFAGSIQDDGIGEDFLLDTVCITDDIVVAAEVPTSANLVAAYPNPFNPTTTLQVELAETGNVNLAIYNVRGQLVQTLVDGMLESGNHSLVFDAASLPSGLYLARMATAQDVQVERLLLTK